ncbi:MarR family winged helix-turn-helix transcriptional regulator [Amnibacterium kyonggiense]
MARASRPSPVAETPTTEADPLYDLLWQTTAYTHLMVEAALADTPLTVASSSMLIAVLQHPGMTIADFARRMPKSQQTLSQVVARLEKLGFIERRLGGGRGVGLHLTPAGQEMAELSSAREREVTARLQELLGEQRATALTRLLHESLALLRQER